MSCVRHGQKELAGVKAITANDRALHRKSLQAIKHNHAARLLTDPAGDIAANRDTRRRIENRRATSIAVNLGAANTATEREGADIIHVNIGGIFSLAGDDAAADGDRTNIDGRGLGTLRGFDIRGVIGNHAAAVAIAADQVAADADFGDGAKDEDGTGSFSVATADIATHRDDATTGVIELDARPEPLPWPIRLPPMEMEEAP